MNEEANYLEQFCVDCQDETGGRAVVPSDPSLES